MLMMTVMMNTPLSSSFCLLFLGQSKDNDVMKWVDEGMGCIILYVCVDEDDDDEYLFLPHHHHQSACHAEDALRLWVSGNRMMK